MLYHPANLCSTGKGKNKGKKATCSADAVTMGDAWLAPAIQQGLLQPVPGATSSRWWVSHSNTAFISL